MNEDGSIKVDNRGLNVLKGKWANSVGKAKFVKTLDTGMLKISFLGPSHAGYNVVVIDKEYKYALVFGRDHDYMWLHIAPRVDDTGIK